MQGKPVRRAEDIMTTKATVKEEKKTLVKNLAGIMGKSGSVAFLDYSGLSVKAQNELKKQLKASGGKMLIAKNTLIKLAGKEAKVPEEALDDHVLTGQTAMVYSEEDAVAPIQVLGKFISENEVMEFKGGIVEGAFHDKEGLVRISKLPGYDVLAGQVVGALGSPLYGLVGVLQGNMQKLVYILSEAKGR